MAASLVKARPLQASPADRDPRPPLHDHGAIADPRSGRGDQVKANHRDAVTLAKLLRAGELTAAWILDATDEAIRDLTRRARRRGGSAAQAPAGQRLPAPSRPELSGKSSWGGRHARWLAELTFEHPASCCRKRRTR
jgi:hypothetical protein